MLNSNEDLSLLLSLLGLALGSCTPLPGGEKSNVESEFLPLGNGRTSDSKLGLMRADHCGCEFQHCPYLAFQLHLSWSLSLDAGWQQLTGNLSRNAKQGTRRGTCWLLLLLPNTDRSPSGWWLGGTITARRDSKWKTLPNALNSCQ